ncbi:MAG: hypothetical protein ACO3PR_07205, partial [Limisphaerales bacterium]
MNHDARFDYWLVGCPWGRGFGGKEFSATLRPCLPCPSQSGTVESMRAEDVQSLSGQTEPVRTV